MPKLGFPAAVTPHRPMSWRVAHHERHISSSADGRIAFGATVDPVPRLDLERLDDKGALLDANRRAPQGLHLP